MCLSLIVLNADQLSTRNYVTNTSLQSNNNDNKNKSKNKNKEIGNTASTQGAHGNAPDIAISNI